MVLILNLWRLVLLQYVIKSHSLPIAHRIPKHHLGFFQVPSPCYNSHLQVTYSYLQYHKVKREVVKVMQFHTSM